MNVQEINAAFNENANGFIDGVIQDYANGKSSIGVGACVVLFHTIKTGDINPVNRFFKALGAGDTNEGKKLKVWLGEYSRFKDETGDIHNTLTFSKEEGIRIKKGTGNIRGMLFPEGLEGLLDTAAHFLDFKKEKVKVDPNIEKLMKMVKSAIVGASNKAGEVGADIPMDLANRMEALKAEIDKYLPQLKGIENKALAAPEGE